MRQNVALVGSLRFDLKGLADKFNSISKEGLTELSIVNFMTLEVARDKLLRLQALGA